MIIKETQYFKVSEVVLISCSHLSAGGLVGTDLHRFEEGNLSVRLGLNKHFRLDLHRHHELVNCASQVQLLGRVRHIVRQTLQLTSHSLPLLHEGFV